MSWSLIWDCNGNALETASSKTEYTGSQTLRLILGKQVVKTGNGRNSLHRTTLISSRVRVTNRRGMDLNGEWI
jgi:hypothetical protein